MARGENGERNNKGEHKKEELLGRAKEKAGESVGNERLTGEGKAQRAEGALKLAVDKVKDAFKKK